MSRIETNMATQSEEFGTQVIPSDSSEAGKSASDSRALVALSPVGDAPELTVGYRSAPFLAHLVATKDQHPQTRERRRADPDVVMAAYRATAALTRVLVT